MKSLSAIEWNALQRLGLAAALPAHRPEAADARHQLSARCDELRLAGVSWNQIVLACGHARSTIESWSAKDREPPKIGSVLPATDVATEPSSPVRTIPGEFSEAIWPLQPSLSIHQRSLPLISQSSLVNAHQTSSITISRGQSDLTARSRLSPIHEMPLLLVLLGHPRPPSVPGSADLGLDLEASAIRKATRFSPLANPAVPPRPEPLEVPDLLRHYRPRYLHVIAHADDVGVWLSEGNDPVPVERDFWYEVLSKLSIGPEHVFLNYCNSEQHAASLRDLGVGSISWSGRIEATVAQSLAVAFYEGLGSGLPRERAHDRAKFALRLAHPEAEHQIRFE